MSTALASLTKTLATKFNMDDGSGLADTLKATCFKGSVAVTDAQMVALLVVANQYGLNPFTREIFAFPDKGSIVPVVGVDGWSRIMNDHPQFDGMDFEQDDQKCTCVIYRKDRSHPIKVTEYMNECKRTTSPWSSHPKRMLRHKAMIQCARMAFGFGGIFDQDEAERIADSEIDITPAGKPIVTMPQRKTPPASAPVDTGTGEIIEGVATVIRPCAQPPATNSELASVGEKAFITNKLAALGRDIQEALDACHLTNFENLTKDGFVTIKDWIRNA